MASSDDPAGATRSREGGDIQPGSREGGDIQPGSREGGDIQPASREGGDIQPGSRTGGDIQPGSRTGGDIQPGSRTGGDIQPASRTESIVTHAEGSISEDAIVAAARERALDIGAGAVTPAVGALMCVLAKLTGAKAVVEVGTGAGVSGLWLLSGMREDGVLTTIDVEPEHQRMAKQAFTEAGVGPSRTRLISGRAQDVLTRLADESYDLVFIDGDPIDQPQFVIEGVRLLRPGGAIVVHRAALGGRAGDANAKDAEVIAVREAARLIAEDDRLTPVLVPLGDGLLAAARD